jgi:NADH:ubiquinone oxidoreductase subunit 3 (subunit A)
LYGLEAPFGAQRMPANTNPYWVIAALLAAGTLFALGPLALAWAWARWVTPARPGLTKNASYECGLPSAGVGPVRFQSQYYLYAILFLVFDVEAVFLLPFAVAFLDLPVGGCVAMVIFLLMLAEGLAWAWLKGLLAWR